MNLEDMKYLHSDIQRIAAIIRDHIESDCIKLDNGAIAIPYDFAHKLAEKILKADDKPVQ